MQSFVVNNSHWHPGTSESGLTGTLRYSLTKPLFLGFEFRHVNQIYTLANH